VDPIAITGVGATTAVGQGKAAVTEALLAGSHAFRVMTRPGRQGEGTAFIGAEIDSFALPEQVPAKLLRTSSLSARVALATAFEAWQDAKLHELDPERVGLVVGGSNVQQRELVLTQNAYRDRAAFLRPTYAQMFMDTDIAAICSEQLGVRGLAYSVGGASASGHLALISAIQAVVSGQVDACIALGALMDLSHWECQGFRALGAMGSERYAGDPTAACRPFDRQHDGFIFGEGCGAVVVERLLPARVDPYATVAGWSFRVDAHRNPDPSLEGEVGAIRTALNASGLDAEAVDYVNPHGTGSPLGDSIELRALKACGLLTARINATKSILGHGLSAAGLVEIVATLLQMRAGSLHPTLNLDDPIDPDFRWVRGEAVRHSIRNALNLSFGFGGINSAICLQNARD
jgi:malonyl-ACP decarboxylase